MKSKSYFKGVFAEYFAMLYLLLCGYVILARRFKTKVGEIDVIAKKSRQLIFIEVKFRQSYEDAALAVTPKNQQRVLRASQAYIQKNPQYEGYEIRFDVVLWSSYARLSHIKNAWIE